MPFSKLLSPGQIGNLEMKNRLVMAPVSIRLATEEGAVTDRIIDFYRERAKGGVGFIILENTCVDWPRGKGPQPFLLRIDHDRYVPGLADLVEELQRFGVKVAPQLQHVGRQTTRYWSGGLGPIGPSPQPGPGCDVPHVLTIDEIHEVIEIFANAAGRAQLAGFDAIEIHGAHGYLFSQFVSPMINFRDDEYGGSFDNRVRFPLEVVRNIREKVGPDYPIIYRYSAHEHICGGLPLEESIAFAQRLEDVGVNALHVTAGLYESQQWIFPPMYIKPGYNRQIAKSIKEAVNIPVIVVGRINNPQLAEEILQWEDADFVSMGRPLLADPDFLNKVETAKQDTICPCIACNECLRNSKKLRRIRCAVNPRTGRESFPQIRTRKSKHILVAGGGPAGMQAATIAKSNGHQVTLFEQNSQLGGQLVAASRPLFKYELKMYLEYLKRQIIQEKVEVQLNTKLTTTKVQELNPDLVIVATGAVPIRPQIPGINGDHVVTALDLLEKRLTVGDNVVVVGGSESGVETAIYLAMEGHKVTIIEKMPNGLVDVVPANRIVLEEFLSKNRLTFLKEHCLVSIHPDHVKVKTPEKETTFFADSIVLAVGFRSESSLINELQAIHCKHFSIGDSIKPANLFQAIHSAYNSILNI